MKNFWGRLGKNVSAETASVIAAYSRDLDSLTQQCRDLITRNTHGDVRKVLDGISQVQGDINSTRDVIQGDTCHALGGIGRALDEVARADLKVQINQLAYADGAGLNNSKSCLDGTRTTLLLEIMDWIYDVEGDPRRILWLHGQAGKGKSVIAHSIAKQCKELGRLGSCFCFARDRMADLRHEKIFSTLARDLCDYDLDFGHALASILSKDNALAHCSDTTQQWQKFILQPFSRISVCTRAPILIVVDALDESGDEASRLHILEILTSLEVASLPPNIRILITSRPLTDITERLQSVLHIKSKSMDGISIDTAKSDIQVYIKHQLRTLVDGLSEKETGFLAEMSDGLFEWARLACEFIRSFKEATTPSKQYQSLILAMSGGREDLLGNMYKAILDNALGKSYGTYVRFRSVMCQILCTKEPLSIDSLNAMRRKFPEKEDIYDVDLILRSLGALFSGIVDRSTPVRPLHASFYDFLTEGPWSEEFAVGIKEMHMSLALASLNVMQEELCFNICNLENSYMRNSAVKDLNVKLKEYISSHLSYACRFWVDHAKEVKYNKNLEKLVKAFFKEKLLFWMEALSLLKGLNNAPTALLCIAQWMEVGLLQL
ncbi:hypothetical protein ID866_7778 [Astraeus odoratus]|nr:hypothetical protein ID866_7778 [Astraeus odoratus]